VQGISRVRILTGAAVIFYRALLIDNQALLIDNQAFDNNLFGETAAVSFDAAVSKGMWKSKPMQG